MEIDGFAVKSGLIDSISEPAVIKNVNAWFVISDHECQCWRMDGDRAAIDSVSFAAAINSFPIKQYLRCIEGRFFWNIAASSDAR